MTRTFLKKHPLFFLPTLAYVLFNFKAFYRSELFDPIPFILFLMIFAIIDIAISFTKLNEAPIGKAFIKTTYILTIILWFGLFCTHNIYLYTSSFWTLTLEPKFWFILVILLITLAEYFLLSRKSSIYFQNVFWAILSLQLIYACIDFNIKYDSLLVVSEKAKKNEGKKSKTTILLITDEYSSPKELKKIDPLINDSLSTYLSKKGWEIKNNFITNETSTIHSLSSLFNYNLSSKNGYANMPVWQIGFNYLIKTPALIEDLKNKNIKIANLGIFQLGDIYPKNKLYYYPTSLYELFLTYSSFFPIWDKLNGNRYSRTIFNPELAKKQNLLILDSLPSITRNKIKENVFIYAHLMMPHSPFAFKEHKYQGKKNIQNYIDYWHFTNQKLIELINQINPDQNIRIIITGDHGLRESVLDPTKTFAAFWGFDKADVDQIQTVQDIGSLIYGYY